MLKGLRRRDLYVLQGSAIMECSRSTTILVIPSDDDFAHLFLVWLDHGNKKGLVKPIASAKSKGLLDLAGDLSFDCPSGLCSSGGFTLRFKVMTNVVFDRFWSRWKLFGVAQNSYLTLTSFFIFYEADA